MREAGTNSGAAVPQDAPKWKCSCEAAPIQRIKRESTANARRWDWMALESTRATDPPIGQMMPGTATLKQRAEGNEGIAHQPRRAPLHVEPWYMHTLSNYQTNDDG